jgi:hypothetical protein
VEAACPPPQLIVDRSFKTPPPACLGAIAPLDLREGVTWGGLAIDQTRAMRDRDLCLEQVVAWIASERQADGAGS